MRIGNWRGVPPWGVGLVIKPPGVPPGGSGWQLLQIAEILMKIRKIAKVVCKDLQSFQTSFSHFFNFYMFSYVLMCFHYSFLSVLFVFFLPCPLHLCCPAKNSAPISKENRASVCQQKGRGRVWDINHPRPCAVLVFVSLFAKLSDRIFAIFTEKRG